MMLIIAKVFSERLTNDFKMVLLFKNVLQVLTKISTDVSLYECMKMVIWLYIIEYFMLKMSKLLLVL